ncbi:MAG: M48 family metallopeptidase [Candidatus Cloacimonetes bacterium]|nr:M48 family metallopeptidase [Candidatus Cloacimonadota bacterium]
MIDYTKYRFEEETVLVKVLEEDFAFRTYYDIFDNEEGLKNVVNSLLANGVKLNHVIAPRLYEICNKVKEVLHFKEDIDFYITSSVNFNAYSINGFGYVPHMICFTSALVEKFTNEELTFVIGHEIGHLIFMHSQLNVVRFLLSNSESKKIPAQIINTFARWSKYAEISSDRMGFLAQPNLEIIGKVFFKFASGLSEEHLNFNIKEYMKQLEKIKDMPRNEFYSSHPNNLVRLKCLELFSKSELYSECQDTPMLLTDLQKEMYEVLNLLEYHPRNDDQKNAVEFLAAVGLYIAGSDKSIHSGEMEILYEYIARYTSQPEMYLRFKDFQEVIERKNTICEHYSQTKNDFKYYLCEQMAFLAIIDGRLDEHEKAVLFEIAERLHIEEDRIKHIILDVSRYIQPVGNKPKFQLDGNFFRDE